MVSVLLAAVAVAQPVNTSDATIEHVRIQPRGYVTEIQYDLHGLANANYRITVALRRRSDESVNRNLIVAEGDIGPGVTPGPNKRVIWGQIGEFPQGLPGNDYFFEVKAEQMKSKSAGILWVGGGAFALCAFLFLLVMRGLTRTGFQLPSARSLGHSIHQ